MALNRPRWKRWRYVMALSAVVSAVTVLVVGLRLGLGLAGSLVMAVSIAGTTAALDLLRWRMHGAHLRQHGWEW